MLNDVGIPRMVPFLKKASFLCDLSTRSHKGYEEHVKEPPMMALDGSGKLRTLIFFHLGWSSKAHYKMNQIPFDIIWWFYQSKHVFLY